MGLIPFLILLILGTTAAPQELEEPEEFTECTDGYEWDPESQHCKDVDECVGEGPPPPCRGSLKCLNHFGGYLCLPPSAAIISPPRADAAPPPPPELPPLPPPPSPGGCPPGYGPDPDGSCQDVDECSGPGPSPCRPSQDCVNLPGGFQCRCPPGYRHLRTECVDQDECRFRWCPQGCSNSPGAFSCRCLPGFQLGPDGRSCLDVDECSLGARCPHGCRNTFGSFRCRCRPGFRLGPDGLSCLDVDECQGGSARCQHLCQNSPGSFSCLCPPGYRLRGLHCHDRDECSEGSHGCRGSQRCLNTFGGHLCLPPRLCPSPYTPHPRTPGTCVCPGGVAACAPLPRWFLPRFLALPNVPDVPSGLFHFHLTPGTPPRLRLRGGPPGAFRLRELSNQSALLELTRPLIGPQQLLLEVELLPPGPRPPGSPAYPPPPPANLSAAFDEAPPPGPALALLRLHLFLGEHPF